MNGFVGGKRTRGPSENKGLEKLYLKHGRLDIFYDSYNTKTWQPVGKYAPKYKSLMGNTINRIPYYYESWADVPDYFRAAVFNALRVCIL